jgi:hypothetical protein
MNEEKQKHFNPWDGILFNPSAPPESAFTAHLPNNVTVGYYASLDAACAGRCEAMQEYNAAIRKKKEEHEARRKEYSRKQAEQAAIAMPEFSGAQTYAGRWDTQ